MIDFIKKETNRQSEMFHEGLKKMFMGLLLIIFYLADTHASQLEAFADGTQTIQASFSQIMFNEDKGIMDKSTGSIFISKPDRLLIKYNSPNNFIILADGKNIWSYDIDLMQAIVTDQESSLRATVASILIGSHQSFKNFVVQEFVDKNRISNTILTPKEFDSMFSQYKIGFKNRQLIYVEMKEKTGRITRMEFENMIVNKLINDQVFSLQLPIGVDIIQDRISYD